MKQVFFNLNDKISVRLTEKGYQHYDQKTKIFSNRTQAERRENYFKNCDEHGCTKFQIWDFMSIFGDIISTGVLPFEYFNTNLKIDYENIKEKLPDVLMKEFVPQEQKMSINITFSKEAMLNTYYEHYSPLEKGVFREKFQSYCEYIAKTFENHYDAHVSWEESTTLAYPISFAVSGIDEDEVRYDETPEEAIARIERSIEEDWAREDIPHTDFEEWAY